MPQREHGYTLYELALTVTVIAVILTLGLPSLSATVARQRQTAEINALFHAFHLARKESIMRRRVVSLCPSIDGRVCTPHRDWSAGWLMFANHDADSPPQIDADDKILQRHRASEQVRIMANRRGFTLRATQKRATNGTFVICDRATRVPPKALVVSYTGRPRVALKNTAGKAYSCAD